MICVNKSNLFTNTAFPVEEVLALCKEKHSEKTYLHCIRVAEYAISNPCCINSVDKDIICKIALCHDLLEDTDATIEEISDATGLKVPFLTECLLLLTKTGKEDYLSYIERLKASSNRYAYIVKIADMKDHLNQKETLTDKLRQKYWEALPILL